MDVYIAKCAAFYFRRGFPIYLYAYTLNNNVLCRVAIGREFGVIMTPSVCPFGTLKAHHSEIKFSIKVHIKTYQNRQFSCI